MNILIQQSKAFPHRDNSFCWFYIQLTDWLTAHGIESKLFYCYSEVVDYGFDNSLLLPDAYSDLYSPKNIEAVCRYIKEKKINVILDYSHIITGKTKKYFQEIKRRHPSVKIFTMIHNCPSHTTQLQRYKLSILQLKDVHSTKQLFQWMFPSLYIWLLKKVVANQNRSAYRTLDEVILLSPSYIPEFQELIKDKTAWRLSSIPNAIRPVESHIPIEQKNKEIIFVGRMEPEKAVPKLLKIWEKIQDELPEWQLTLVGDGSCLNATRELIRSKQLKRVNLTGHQMAIPYIDRASILCLTSVIEGLPTVFIEAMSLGVVPVGFGSFRAIYDMIESGKNGFIIPEDDYEEYAATLLRLAKDNALRRRIATAAQSKKTRYDIDRIGPLWMEAFRKHGLIQ